MSLPTLSGTGRATGDAELRFSPSGTAVCKVNLAFNSRRKNQQTGEWEDDSVFFINAVAFKQLAEHLAETVTKGTEVVVTGRLKTEQWKDKQTGDNRSAPSLLIDSIGPNLAYATAKVQKMQRDSSSNGGQQNRGGDDQWANATPAPGNTGSRNSNYDEEAPF